MVPSGVSREEWIYALLTEANVNVEKIKWFLPFFQKLPDTQKVMVIDDLVRVSIGSRDYDLYLESWEK